jgi:protein-glutamine gamma-glutamyltransferase
MSAKSARAPLKFFNQPLLFGSIFVAMATASTELPVWIIIFSLILILWRLAFEELDLPKVKTRWTTLIGLLLFIFTYVQYRTIWGQVESATILAGLISISILNYETERDHRILILLGFILSAMKPMFVIDLVWAIPSFICLVGLWISLLPNVIVHKWKYFGRISLYSLPLLVILFLLFPRIVIFQTNRSSAAISTSGFSEDLNPGRFSSLVQSDKAAFYAEFKGEVLLSDDLLANKDLYWRGGILSESNGFEWKRRSRLKEISKNAPLPVTNRNSFLSKFSYSVIMEPMDHRIVFSLDVPSQLKTTSVVTDTSEYGIIRLSAPLSQQKQFDFVADPTFQSLNDLPDDPAYLELKNLPPKTKEWITQVNKQNLSYEQKIKTLERFFSLSGFRYTLSPGTYEKNDLDEFLFVRKRGFCEHFAAAYATLARALKIPARVIIGYQGGEYNTIGGFWKISQRDAHAWVEIGHGLGWTRIDPTVWIAPLRLNISARQFFSLSDTDQILFGRENKLARNNLEILWNQTTHFIDNLNYAWTVFLLEYDKEKQLALLGEFLETNQLLSVLKVLFILFLIYATYRLIILYFARKSRREVLSQVLAQAEIEFGKRNITVKKSATASEIFDLIRIHFPQSTISDFEKIYDEENYIRLNPSFVSFLEEKRMMKMIDFKVQKKQRH